MRCCTLACYRIPGRNLADLKCCLQCVLALALYHVARFQQSFVQLAFGLPPFVLILAYHFHPRNMISKTTPQHDRSLDLAIIGGGLAGLTLSIGLSKFGIKHTIYESANRFSDIGAGISTGKNAIAALALIDPRIIECYDRCAVSTPSEQSDLPHMSFRWGMAQKHRDGLE